MITQVSEFKICDWVSPVLGNNPIVAGFATSRNEGMFFDNLKLEENNFV